MRDCQEAFHCRAEWQFLENWKLRISNWGFESFETQFQFHFFSHFLVFLFYLHPIFPQGAEGGEGPRSGQRENLKSALGVSVSTMMCPDEQLSDQDKTIFHWCQEGNVDMVKAMLTSGQEVDECDPEVIISPSLQTLCCLNWIIWDLQDRVWLPLGWVENGHTCKILSIPKYLFWRTDLCWVVRESS